MRPSLRESRFPVSELVVGMKCGGSDGLIRDHGKPGCGPLQRHDGGQRRLHCAYRGAGDVWRRGLLNEPLRQ